MLPNVFGNMDSGVATSPRCLGLLPDASAQPMYELRFERGSYDLHVGSLYIGEWGLQID